MKTIGIRELSAASIATAAAEGGMLGIRLVSSPALNVRRLNLRQMNASARCRSC